MKPFRLEERWFLQRNIFDYYTTFDGRRLLNVEGVETSRVNSSTVTMDGLLNQPFRHQR